jgi:hypothetical protein
VAITIEIGGVAYPFPDKFTGKDLSLIKRLSGVRGNELTEALKAGDYDLTIALAAIVLERAGQTPDIDKLYALEVGEIRASDDTPEEEDESPPAAAADGAAAGNEASTPITTLPVMREASGGQG